MLFKASAILSLDGVQAARPDLAAQFDPSIHAGFTDMHGGSLVRAEDELSERPVLIDTTGCGLSQIEAAIQANAHTHDPHPDTFGKFIRRGPISLTGTPSELTLDEVVKLYTKRYPYIADKPFRFMAGGSTTGFSTTWDLNFLKLILGKTVPSVPAGMYVGLDSATPTADNGSFTELVVGTSPGYARATINASNADAAWSATTTDSTGVWRTNVNTVQHAAASGLWLTATGGRLWDAATLGVDIGWFTLTSPVTVPNGTIPLYLAGAIKVTVA